MFESDLRPPFVYYAGSNICPDLSTAFNTLFSTTFTQLIYCVTVVSTRVVTAVKTNQRFVLTRFVDLDCARLAWGLEIQFTYP